MIAQPPCAFAAAQVRKLILCASDSVRTVTLVIESSWHSRMTNFVIRDIFGLRSSLHRGIFLLKTQGLLRKGGAR